MKTETLKIYKDGATIRLHNRRISFIDNKRDVLITFENLDSEPNRPSFVHKCHRNKIRETVLKMSSKAMESLLYAYIEYRKTNKS